VPAAVRGDSTRKLWESGASLQFEQQRVRLRRTVCPNHVALRSCSEDAAVEFEWHQSGWMTLMGGCELRTRTKDMLGSVMKVEIVERLRAAEKAGQ
jgi:hypothetical protein